MSQRRKSPVKPEPIEPQMCSHDLRLQILHELPFFVDLSHGDVQKINEFFRERGYEQGMSIFFAGDEVKRLYVVAMGKVKLMRHTLSGQDILLDILVPGEFFGSLSTRGNEVNPDTAIAQTTLCALSIEVDEFRQIMNTYPSVALAVLAEMDHRLKAAHEMVRQLSAYSVEQRIAYILLKLGEKVGEQQEVGLLIQMPLSREDVAAMTGTTTESASRVLSQFQKKGFIATGRQWIAIVCLDELQALAEVFPL